MDGLQQAQHSLVQRHLSPQVQESPLQPEHTHGQQLSLQSSTHLQSGPHIQPAWERKKDTNYNIYILNI